MQVSNTKTRTVSDIIDNEYKEYSKYVLEQRALPSAVDGLKKVGRLLLYAMINGHKGKKTKIADLGGISCVPGYMMVTVNDLLVTVEQAVAEFKPGDVVYAYNELSGLYGNAILIDAWLTKTTNKLVNFFLENGAELDVTPDHMLMTNRGWLRADSILLDDIIFAERSSTSNGLRVILMETLNLDEEINVYDFTTSYSTFCVGKDNMVVHNCYGYHHGEASAMGAAVTLTADWNNNVPLFNGYGNFGSRLIQDAAAPRYIFADLNQDFYKYFSDFDVCNPNKDTDCPEPQQYLPIIPWVLVNGIEGIAVGFACRFLSHSPKDLANACILEVKNKLDDSYVLPVTLPGFKGEIIQETQTKVITRGLVERTKRNTWVINEVPWGYDREKFFMQLDKMMDQNKIQDFEDNCDDAGFKFTVKLDGAMDEKCAQNPIDYFKLERSYTENYTALDEVGNLILFDTKVEIIKWFVNFRIKKVQDGLEFSIVKVNSDLDWYKLKLEFITSVVNKTIDVMSYKRAELQEYCMTTYSIDKDTAQRLMSTPVYDMTEDMTSELKKKISSLEAELVTLKNTEAKTLYLSMLKKIA